ncbi:MAG: transporter small permease [Blastococcus sp.]|jgi:TRAP-type C4-dicarboxylate transport system permease small subunit|nr:transporter small permease [Blastococcus sp.]
MTTSVIRRRGEKVANGAIKGAEIIGVVSLVLIVGLLLYEAASRVLWFLDPGHGALERTRVLMVLMLTASLPVAVVRGPMIEADVTHRLFRTRLQIICDYATCVLAVAFFGLLAWESIPWVLQSLEFRERLGGLARVPIYPFKLFFTAVLTLSTVTLLIGCIATRGAPPWRRHNQSVTEVV